MGMLVADDLVLRPANSGQGQGIGRGAGKDEIHVAVRLEQFPDEIGGFCCPFILAVSGGKALVGTCQGGPGLRDDPSGVIAGEVVFQSHG